MSFREMALADRKPPVSLNLVCSGGGSRAVLGASGVILACQALGITNWRTEGGISGGSIPSLIHASGVPPSELVRQVIKIDFSSMFTPLVSMPRIWWAFFTKECAWKTRSTEAVLGSERIGSFVEQFTKTWPENYWTMAVAGEVPLLFTAKGVFELSPDGLMQQVSSEPAPVGLIVRGTCAVPGIIEAVAYNGMYLLDGALTPWGTCPVTVAKRSLGAQSGKIIAAAVGEDSAEALRKEGLFLRLLRRVLCGPCCDPNPDPPIDSDGVVLVKPALSKVESLKFVYSADEKWRAVMDGFSAAVSALEASGHAGGYELVKAKALISAVEANWQGLSRKHQFADTTDRLLASQGW